jgi:hypothetical protein
MNNVNLILALAVLFLVTSVSGCSDVETSESLKEKYGLTPVGVEACDSYLNKLRMCLDKAPSKKHSTIVEMYTFIISDMKNLAMDTSPEAQQMVIEACNIGDSTNRASMEAMGCDW